MSKNVNAQPIMYGIRPTQAVILTALKQAIQTMWLMEGAPVYVVIQQHMFGFSILIIQAQHVLLIVQQI